MVSPEMGKVKEQLRALQSKTVLSVEASRSGLEGLASLAGVPRGAKREAVMIETVPAKWFWFPGALEKKVILYLHGGGYIAGSIITHQDLGARIARASNTRILIIDYRRAPEHPFPAALDDAVTAYRWLTSTAGLAPENIVIAGDSAGGGLTAATLVKLRDDGIPLPAAAVMLSPWTDLAHTGNSVKLKVAEDPFLTPAELEFDAKLYIKTNHAKNPLISPLYADLAGLPPLLIQVGTAEILLDDAIRLAERAKAAGVDVTLDIWPDMVHVWQAFALVAPESREAIEKIGTFIKKFLS
jgi:monoterpene epsilon-lactone hydrolase